MFPDNFKNWIRENPDKVGIHLFRLMFALLWIGQGLSKVLIRDNNMYKDNNEFLGELVFMKDTHPNSFIVTILNDIIIENNGFFLYLIVFTELFIGISLAIGIFSRLGSIIGGLMTIALWILTLGWDEWIWTYPLIFFPHVIFYLSHVGKEIGIDRVLSNKETFNNRKIFNLIM